MIDPMNSEAKIETTNAISAIWLIPAVALLMGGWMLYQQWRDQGPLVTIEFSSASGLEENKTKIKALDVDIGEVKSIALKKDSNGVIVSARIKPESRHLLREDTSFWIVSPRIDHAGISGLNTLLSGAYIELSPGQSGPYKTEFEGLENAPITPAGTPGIHITLNSNDEFAFSEGDPIIYKGLTVGQVEDIYFNLYERVVYYNAFIKSPYNTMITSNTRFWNASGVRLDLTTDGISVQTGNLETLLTNGVSFGIPEGMELGEAVTERAYYTIYPTYEEAVSPQYEHVAEYVILISDTVRGLQVGAPVEYRGLEVGTVKAVNINGPEKTSLLENDYKIPVLISIEPGRVGLADDKAGLAQVEKQIDLWVTSGLRASLQVGNILTGKLFVDLQHYPEQPNVVATRFEDYRVIPTNLDDFSQITQKASAVLDKFNKLPLNDIALNANSMLEEFSATAKEFQNVSTQLNALLESADDQQLFGQLNKTLENVAMLAKDFSQGSSGYEQLVQALNEFNRTLQQLQPLLLQLNQQPNSLIFSGNQTQNKQPTAQSEGTRK